MEYQENGRIQEDYETEIIERMEEEDRIKREIEEEKERIFMAEFEERQRKIMEESAKEQEELEERNARDFFLYSDDNFNDSDNDLFR